MKIVRFTAENFKRLSVVEITPDGHVIEITGKNGAGKSSVLDAIWVALEGLRVAPARAIRKGAKEAKITIRLGNGGGDNDIVVTRRFTAKGSSIKVETLEGLVYQTPQAILDNMIGELSFDPLAFVAMRPEDQFKELIKVAKVDLDFAALDRLDVLDYDTRTTVNRDAKRLRAAADEIKLPEDLPEKPVDAVALSQEIEAGISHNAEIDSRQTAIVDAGDKVLSASDAVKDLKATLKRAENELTRVASILDSLKGLARVDEKIDLTDLRDRMTRAAEINTAIENGKAKQRRLDDALDAEEKSEALTKAMDGRKADREAAVSKAKMPVAELGLEDGIVTFDGIPFSQASTAEQIRVSVGIAMAANPKLRVIRINEGSHLDSDGLEMISEMAKTDDYQVWIERVDESGKIGIVIEDGHVAGVEPPAEATAADGELALGAAS